MALIKCPECGKEISDRATSCPNCGCPSIDKEEAEKVNDTTRGIIALFLCVLGFVMALVINDGILLLLPAVILILSAILSIKCGKKFSIIVLLASGFALALIITTLIFG